MVVIILALFIFEGNKFFVFVLVAYSKVGKILVNPTSWIVHFHEFYSFLNRNCLLSFPTWRTSMLIQYGCLSMSEIQVPWLQAFITNIITNRLYHQTIYA